MKGKSFSLLFVLCLFSHFLNAQCTADGGSISTSGNRYVCAGDGEADLIDASVVANDGESNQWVITDNGGNILGLPANPPFNFEGAGAGTCYIYNLSYNGAISGLEMGMNINGLIGCFDFSNRVSVTRRSVNGGTISTNDPTSFCVGDGEADLVSPTVSNWEGNYHVWIITDSDGNMLAFPKKFPIDFDGAGVGVCQIWHVAYTFGLRGIGIGSNIFDLYGCHSLSNPISVNRTEGAFCDISGGIISTTDPTTICAGDGVGDPIDVTLIGAAGTNMGWIITSSTGEILGLPPGPPFDLDGAGAGVCNIYHISYEDGLTGMMVGSDINDLEGTFALSNAIAVTRNTSEGGVIALLDETTELSICVGDSIPDPFDVKLDGNSGSNQAWVITDSNGTILGLPPSPPFDLEGADGGTCLVWNLNYADGLSGLSMGENTENLEGCFSFSNSITVIRSEATAGLSGGTITTNSSTSICVGDGSPDFIFANLMDEFGPNSQWVITDSDRNILALPMSPPFNLEGAGAGTCLIYHISYDDGLIGLEMGLNLDDLSGCSSASNSIAVEREGVNGGMLTFSNGMESYTICAGDGVADPLDVSISGTEGTSQSWVITDQDFMILGVPPGPPFDLDGAGEGICLIWGISHNGAITGLEMGANALELEGCLALSNAISVTRIAVADSLAGGTITTSDSTTICAGDGNGDPINVELTGEFGPNSGWIITDSDLNILGLPMNPPFDLDGAGGGVCLIWHISSVDGLRGVLVGANVADIQGCFELSNSIAVTRNGVNGGTLSLLSGSQDTSICAGDGIADPLDVIVSGSEGTDAQWIITNQVGEILGLPAGPPFDLDGAGAGTCFIWYVRSNGALTGVDAGLNAMEIEGCYDLSNPISVRRDTLGGACGQLLHSPELSLTTRSTKLSAELFPNPATNELNIRIDAQIEGLFDISIIDVSGKVVDVSTKDHLLRGELIQKDISTLQKGYYFIRITSEKYVKVMPFIKG